MPDEGSAAGSPGPGVKMAIVVALAAAVVAVFVIKGREGAKPSGGQNGSSAGSGGKKLPRLLDLGAGKCVPCKTMAPILDELKKEYQGRLDVVFIDVWKNPDAGRKYGVQSIPTQIFYDADGRELFRHVGFYSKADILGKWKELGLNFDGGKPD